MKCVYFSDTKYNMNVLKSVSLKFNKLNDITTEVNHRSMPIQWTSLPLRVKHLKERVLCQRVALTKIYKTIFYVVCLLQIFVHVV